VPAAAEFGTGQVFLSFLWFFLFFIWIWLLIVVFSDIFRSHDLSGWALAEAAAPTNFRQGGRNARKPLPQPPITTTDNQRILLLNARIVGREAGASASGSACRASARCARSVGGLGPGLTSDSADAGRAVVRAVVSAGPQVVAPPVVPI
jgi:hypothetical protein